MTKQDFPVQYLRAIAPRLIALLSTATGLHATQFECTRTSTPLPYVFRVWPVLLVHLTVIGAGK